MDDKKLKDYVISLKEKKLIRSIIFFYFNKIWNFLKTESSENLKIPDVCPSDDKHILIAWDNGECHLEIEIFEDGLCEYFLLNRKDDSFEEIEWDVNIDIIPKKVIRKIQELFS